MTLARLIPALFVAFSLAASAMPPAPTTGTALSGTVLEARDGGGYTYLRLRTKSGEVWAAVPAAQVKTGAEVSIANPQTMSGFQSKALNRTFDTIVFGTLAGAGAQAQAAPDLRAMHAETSKAPKVPEVKVEKAKGANAQTVAGIVGSAPKLKDKPVTVRGQVVKFSSGIMGKNWLHLRDGTGSSRDGTDDLVVVTNDSTSVGEVVLVSGTVRTDRDLGMGYTYKVLVEDARLAK
jgi:hypothetical protein